MAELSEGIPLPDDVELPELDEPDEPEIVGVDQASLARAAKKLTDRDVAELNDNIGTMPLSGLKDEIRLPDDVATPPEVTDDDTLNAVFQASINQGLDNAGKISAVAEATGLSSNLIKNQLPNWERRMLAAQFNPVKFKQDNPELARLILRKPQLAPAIVKDIEPLAKLEQSLKRVGHWFVGGWIFDLVKDVPDVPKDVSLGFEFGKLQSRLEEIAIKQHAHALGQGAAPSADELKEADDLELEMAFLSAVRPDLGFLGGMPGAAVEQVKRYIAQAEEIANYTALGAGAGAGMGSAALGVGAVPGAIIGAGLGLKMGVFAATSRAEGAMFYRQMVKEGADPKAAAQGGIYVGVANGLLEALPLDKVLRLTPGAKAVIAGPTADIIRRYIAKPTVANALLRGGARMAEGMAFEGITEGLQEVTNVFEADRVRGKDVGASLASVWNDLTAAESAIRSSAVKGAQAAGGMTIASPFAAAEVVVDLKEALEAPRVEKMWTAVGEALKDSQLIKDNPAIAKDLVKSYRERYGFADSVALPVKALAEFFQAEGLSTDEVQTILPDVARQMEGAGPTTEVVINSVDFISQVMSRSGHVALIPDIRVGNKPTAREAPAVQKEAEKILEEVAKRQEAMTAGGDVVLRPGLEVFEAVRKSLIDIGEQERVASKDAALWQAFANARASRLNVTALDYFKGLNLTITREASPEVAVKDKRGLLNLYQKDDPRLTEHQRELHIRAEEAATAEERKAALDELIETLMTDELTGANTPSAWQRFAPKDAFGNYVDPKPGWYLAIDVNDLKRVNDTLGGHAAGDVLLRTLAQTMSPEIRQRRGKFFRSGGDELTAHFQTKAQAEEALQAITKVVNAMPFLFEGAHKASVSVGLADHPMKADAASLKAKEQARAAGRSGFGRPGAPDVVDLSKGDVFAEVDTSVSAEPVQLEQLGGSTVRGVFTTSTARNFFKITLSDKNNLSTFLHESAHAFMAILERDAMTDARSGEEIQAIKDWLGVTGKQKITKTQYEEFARGFEAFLREGKAPSTFLAEVFQSFKAWLRSIYATIAQLDVVLNDDIRGVMDRMLATDMEIKEARVKLGVVPLEDNSKLMTPKEYTAYRQRFERAWQAAEDVADRAALREYYRIVSDERHDLMRHVEKAAREDPVFNARELILNGRRLSGEASPATLLVAGRKLDRDAIKNLPLDKVGRTRLLGLTEQGGLDLTLAAKALGFPDGTALLTALAGRPDMNTWVRQETDRRMAEKYPGYKNNRAWQQENAQRALHDAEIGNALWAGMVAMSRKLGGQAGASAKMAIKTAAERRVGEMTLMEMRPHLILREEARAAREVAEAWRKGDARAAFDAARRQLFHHFLWQEVDTARTAVKEITDFFGTFKETDKRKRLSKGGGHLLDAIDSVLSTIEFGQSLESGKKLANAVADLRDQGYPIALPPGFDFSTISRDFESMTLNDLRVVENLVKNLAHLARENASAWAEGEKATFDEVADATAGSIRSNLGVVRPAESVTGEKSRIGETLWSKVKTDLRTIVWHLGKMEFLARVADGGKTAGFFHKYFFQPIADAEASEHTMMRDVFRTLRDEFKRLPLWERMRHDQTVKFLGHDIALRDVLMIAFNMRNQGNVDRLVKDRGWAPTDIVRELDRLLTDSDLATVNGIGRLIESLWPGVVKVYKRVYGFEPTKVTGENVILPSGRVLEGGYFPILRDPRPGTDRQSSRPDPLAHDLWDDEFVSSLVGHGFTETRARNANTPLWLNLDALPSHIVRVIHFITHFEATHQVDRLVKDARVKTALIDGLSEEAYAEIRPWLLDVVKGGETGAEIVTGFDKYLRHTRSGATMVLMGGKMATATIQLLGITMTAKELSFKDGRAHIFSKDAAKYLVLGTWQVLHDMEKWITGQGPSPFKAVEAVNDEWILHRENYERDLRYEYKRLTSALAEVGHARKRVAEFSMALFNLFQGTVNAITWHAALRKAHAEGHERPADYANAVIRMSQSSGGPKDLAGIQRGPEWKRWATVLYSFASLLINSVGEASPKALSAPQKVAHKAAVLWWVVLAPAIASVFMRGDSEDYKDPETFAKAVTLESSLLVSRGVPLFGDLPRAMAGKQAKQAPWMEFMYEGAKSLGKVAGVADSKRITDRDVENLINMLGVAGKLPTQAGINTYRYLNNMSRMEDPILDTFTRTPKRKR